MTRSLRLGVTALLTACLASPPVLAQCTDPDWDTRLRSLFDTISGGAAYSCLSSASSQRNLITIQAAAAKSTRASPRSTSRSSWSRRLLRVSRGGDGERNISELKASRPRGVRGIRTTRRR